jgi:hypothetical protein
METSKHLYIHMDRYINRHILGSANMDRDPRARWLNSDLPEYSHMCIYIFVYIYMKIRD